MSENWTGIAAEIATAISGIGFGASVSRPIANEPVNPWDTAIPGAPTVYSVTVIDDGIRNIYEPGSLIARKARVLTIGATGFIPAVSDVITVRGAAHEVLAVMPLAPGGVDLLYDIELGA